MALFHVHRNAQVLVTADGDVVPLRPQSFRVLDFLLRNQGRIVPRKLLGERLWPDRVVTDDSLTQCIADIRRALGPRCRGLLRTYPKRGYRLSVTDPASGEVLIRTLAEDELHEPETAVPAHRMTATDDAPGRLPTGPAAPGANAAETPRPDSSADAPIGREAECRLIGDLWRYARGGEVQWAALSGPAGIGKSCLARHLVDSVAHEDCRVLCLQCAPRHVADPFWPLVQHLCGSAETERCADEARRERLRERLAAVHDDETQRDRVASLLLPRTGGADTSAAGRDRHSGEVWMLTRRLLSRYFLRASSLRPLILLIEDLHWIDPSSAEWLEQFVEAARHRPVLLLTTSRSSDIPEPVRHPSCTLVRLNRLCAEDARRLARRTCGDRLDRREIERVVETTGGNPLFILEWTRALRDARHPVPGLERAAGGASASRSSVTKSPGAVSDTLLDSLLSRIGRNAAARETLQHAACLGLEFGRPELARLSTLDHASLDAALELLMRAELLGVSETEATRRMRFRHDLLRQAAHESMDPDERVRCHGILYAALAASGTADDALLSHHAFEAGRVTAALEHAERAGESALRRSAFREAILHFDRAVEILASLSRADPARHVALLVRSAHASIGGNGFAHPATAARFERARALLELCPDSPERYPVAYGRWAVTFFAGRYGEALRHARAIEEESCRGTPEEQFLAHRLLGINRYMLGELDGAERHFRRAMERFEPGRRAALNARYGTDLELSMRLSRAMTLLLRGEVEGARELVPSVGRLLDASDENTNTLGFALSRVLLFQYLAESADVDETARVATDFAERHGLDLAHGIALGVRASLELARRRPSRALPLIESGCRLLERSGARLFQGHFRAVEYAVRTTLGDPAAAATRERLFDESDEWTTSWQAAECRRLLALTDRTGDADPAPACVALREALEIAHRQDARLLALRVAETLGEVLLDARRPRDALTLLRAERSALPAGGHCLPVWDRTRGLLETARAVAFAEPD